MARRSLRGGIHGSGEALTENSFLGAEIGPVFRNPCVDCVGDITVARFVGMAIRKRRPYERQAIVFRHIDKIGARLPHVVWGTPAIRPSEHRQIAASRRSLHVPSNAVKDRSVQAPPFSEGKVVRHCAGGQPPHPPHRGVFVEKSRYHSGTILNRHRSQFAPEQLECRLVETLLWPVCFLASGEIPADEDDDREPWMQRQAVMAQSQPHLIQAETGDAEMVDRSSPKPFFQERAKRCSSRHAHTERERISREHDLGDLRRGIEFPFAPKSRELLR